MEVVCATTGPLVRIDIHRARIFGLIDTSMYVPSCLVTFATIINPKYKGNSLIGLGSQSVSLWQKLPTRTITSGLRLRLRDIRVFFAVIQSRSLAKAAVQLRVSQPAVSQVIANLEHALGI